MTDWEARMAIKAHARADQRWEVEQAQRAAAERQWHEANDTTVEAYVNALAAELSEGATYTPIVCACTGAPSELWHLSDEAGQPPCHCELREMAVMAVKARAKR